MQAQLPGCKTTTAGLHCIMRRVRAQHVHCLRGLVLIRARAEAGVDKKVVEFLLRNGAVWNLGEQLVLYWAYLADLLRCLLASVDTLGFVRSSFSLHGNCYVADQLPYLLSQTAADVAYSLNYAGIYQTIVMEGVRSELLKAVLEADGSESMSVDADDDPTEEEDQQKQEPAKSTAANNEAFLASKLTFETHSETGEERCLDSEGNGVMMGWEAPIMAETARLLCPSPSSEEDHPTGLSVLNVGFGLGIIDSELQKHGKPSRHVIIEPHPDVLAHARSKGWFDREGVEIFQGTWQDYMKVFRAGEQAAEFDAIYVSAPWSR